MKKLPVLVSVLMMAALLLAACGGANNDNNINELTPGVGNTTGTQIVPETGAEVLPTATLPATEVVVVEPTATVATVDQATPVATTTVATTTDGVNECRPFQLTSYLDYEIVGADGEEIGEVDGVVVLRDAALVPAAGAPDFTGFTAGQFTNPVVAYLVVDFDDAAGYGDAETLIPFGAFDALNEQTAFEDCRLVLSNSYELDGFAEWDWDALPDFNEANWDNEWAGFWSNLGVNVATTSPTGQQLGNPVVFRDNFDDINVLNLEGEDLGEIEEFILDPATGEITHGVLTTGGFLGIGEKWIPIPMSQIMWGNYDEENNDLGEIYINHPDDNWSEAPVIDDLDGVDFSLDTWDNEYDLYWEGVNTR